MDSSNDALAWEDLIVKKGTIGLAVRRKRLRTCVDWELPVLVLVHGSSLSALPTFDLTVPGKHDYSMMNWFAARRFDVWTVDHEGYGNSTRTDGNSDVRSGVEDLEALASFIQCVTDRPRLLLYGLSSGALRAAAFAATRPERVERLVLDGFVWTGEGSPELAKRKAATERYRSQARRAIDREFIVSIFTRDREGTSEEAVVEACANAQLAFGTSVPTGTYVDMTCNLPLVDPASVLAPTAVLRGEFDGIAAMEDLLGFFVRLPNPDKQFSVLPGLAHCTPLGVERRRMWETTRAFLTASAARNGVE